MQEYGVAVDSGKLDKKNGAFVQIFDDSKTIFVLSTTTALYVFLEQQQFLLDRLLGLDPEQMRDEIQ